MKSSSVFSSRLKNKLLLFLVTIFSLVSPFSPFLNNAFAYEDGDLICSQVSYKGERPTSGATETRSISFCSKVTSKGVISGGKMVIYNELTSASDLIIKDISIEDENYQRDQEETPTKFDVVYTRWASLEEKQTRTSSAAATSGNYNVATGGKSFTYEIDKTNLNDFARDFRDDLPDEVEENGVIWKKQDATKVVTGNDALVIANKANVVDHSTIYGDNICGEASGIAWFLCPLIETISDALMSIYRDQIVPMLDIKPALLTNETAVYGDGVPSAWRTFQNFANIALIILLLFIVFSQLTGIGIDNYGIKKALPKLIVAIVLANLSYFICQIAVDVSNILGNSLQSFFDSMAQNLSTQGSVGSSVLANVTSTAAGAGMIVGIIALLSNPITGAAATIFAVDLILKMLPVIAGALVVALVAVLFLFLTLGIRQAGVVLMTVIAPLACICYILPNTKPLFDKYIKAFKGLILLYPICGLLMGGANYASTLLLLVGGDDNGFVYSMVALMINVVPIFFIPTLLKKSLAAFGDIGSKIMGFGQRTGQRLGRAASNAVRNNSSYKNALAATQTAKAEKLAELSAKRNDRRLRRDAVGRDQDRELKNNANKNAQDKINKALEERKNKFSNDLFGKKYDELNGMQQAIVNAREKMGRDQEKRDEIKGLRKDAKTEYENRLSQEATEEKRKEAFRNWNPIRQNMFNSTAGELGKLKGTRISGENTAGFEGASTGRANTQAEATKTDDAINADRLSNYNKQYIKQGSSVYAQRPDGKYVNKAGKELSAADAKELVANGGAQAISYSQAKIAAAAEEQAKQFGATAAYANIAKAERAANAAVASGLNNSDEAIRDTINEGRESVLQLRHDEARNKRVKVNAQADAGISEVDYKVEKQKSANQKIISDTETAEYKKAMPDLDLSTDTAQENVANAVRRRIFEEASSNQVKAPAPDFETIKAGVEAKRTEQEISDISSLIASQGLGTVEINGEEVKVNSRNAEALGLKMQQIAGNAEDAPKVRAIIRQLKTLGGQGQSVLAQAIDSGAFASAPPEIQSGIITEIVSDSKMKAADTALFKALQKPNYRFASGEIENYRNSGDYVDSLKNDYVGSMSDDAFKGVFGAFDKNGNYVASSVASKTEVQELAYNTLRSDKTLQALKQNQIKVLREVVKGYTPPDQS